MTKLSLVLLRDFWFLSLVRRAKEKIDEKKLNSWKLLDDFRRRLAKVQAAVPTIEKRPGGPERLLLEKDYFSLMLFGMFNPILDSMRGLCAASHLQRVQDEVCSRPVSLGSFSEAQSVFDPELLKQVFLELAGEIPTTWGDPRLAHLADKLKLVDGTLLPALPLVVSQARTVRALLASPTKVALGWRYSRVLVLLANNSA